MSNQSDNSVEAIKATLSALAEDYGRDRYYECLVNACGVLLREKDARESPLNNAALQFIHQCSLRLGEARESAKPAKQTVACSFCGKSAPEVRLGAGPSSFICNECVDIFHNIL